MYGQNLKVTEQNTEEETFVFLPSLTIENKNIAYNFVIWLKRDHSMFKILRPHTDTDTHTHKLILSICLNINYVCHSKISEPPKLLLICLIFA